MAKVKKKCDYNSVLATRLRELLDASGTTITAAAEAAGVTRQAFSAYQDGSTQPTADTLTKIANFFNVSVDYLLGLSETQSTDTTIKAVCAFTGLSAISVERLHSFRRPEIHPILNELLESANFWVLLTRIDTYRKKRNDCAAEQYLCEGDFNPATDIAMTEPARRAQFELFQIQLLINHIAEGSKENNG